MPRRSKERPINPSEAISKNGRLLPRLLSVETPCPGIRNEPLNDHDCAVLKRSFAEFGVQTGMSRGRSEWQGFAPESQKGKRVTRLPSNDFLGPMHTWVVNPTPKRRPENAPYLSSDWPSSVPRSTAVCETATMKMSVSSKPRRKLSLKTSPAIPPDKPKSLANWAEKRLNVTQ